MESESSQFLRALLLLSPEGSLFHRRETRDVEVDARPRCKAAYGREVDHLLLEPHSFVPHALHEEVVGKEVHAPRVVRGGDEGGGAFLCLTWLLVASRMEKA